MGKKFNIANLLSLSRIFVCFPLIFFLDGMHINDNYKFYSIIVIIYIVISDVLDGYFARKFNYVTNLGKIIDPVADKISFMTVLVYLIDTYNFYFLIFFILLSIRDIILLAYSLYFILYTDYVPQANNLGKIFIFCCVLMLIFNIYEFNIILANVFYVLSLFLLFASTINYIKEHSLKLKHK